MLQAVGLLPADEVVEVEDDKEMVEEDIGEMLDVCVVDCVVLFVVVVLFEVVIDVLLAVLVVLAFVLLVVEHVCNHIRIEYYGWKTAEAAQTKGLDEQMQYLASS